MLKHIERKQMKSRLYSAAFGRLCVETTPEQIVDELRNNQPPSGGCVLKHGTFFISYL